MVCQLRRLSRVVRSTVRGKAGVHVGLYALTRVVRIVRACQHPAGCPP